MMSEERHYSDEEEDDVERNEEEDETSTTSSSAVGGFLAELNLIMIVTFLTLSDEDLSKMDESEKLAVVNEEREAKVKMSAATKMYDRRKLQGGLKSADRGSISGSQPRILDSRHGRKM